MNFITFFLTVSSDSSRSYYTPARWTNGLSVPGKQKGSKIDLSSVENGSKGKLPAGTPSAILPAVDVDTSNLPEKISWDVAKQTTVAFTEQS
tara:strand:- start:135 stop:410 length:276 start_codon:yes stop_codon:yes gene_type:complete